MELRVSSRSQGDHTIVTLAGEIDLYTAPRLQSELLAAMRSDSFLAGMTTATSPLGTMG